MSVIVLVSHSNKGKCGFTGELNRDEEQNIDICTNTLCEVLSAHACLEYMISFVIEWTCKQQSSCLI